MGVWVEGDRARLKQVVVNLLDNAIKYTPEGGAVCCERPGHEDRKAVLEVVGQRHRHSAPRRCLDVFERFFRVDKARSRETGRSRAWALSIVKSICTAHHGRVEVQQRSRPGQPLPS